MMSTVFESICDDGKRDEVKAIIDDSRLKDPNCLRGAHVRYVARTKTPGVPHHAKAGNLNPFNKFKF